VTLRTRHSNHRHRVTRTKVTLKTTLLEIAGGVECMAACTCRRSRKESKPGGSPYDVILTNQRNVVNRVRKEAKSKVDWRTVD